MSTPESRVIPLQGVVQREASRCDNSSPETPEHLSALARQLEQRLVNADRCEDTWRCLVQAQGLPMRALDTEIVFSALERLSQSESVFLRGAAYRWLAELHRRNLRFEMRAKRLLYRALEQETGPTLLRVTHLLRRC